MKPSKRKHEAVAAGESAGEDASTSAASSSASAHASASPPSSTSPPRTRTRTRSTSPTTTTTTTTRNGTDTSNPPPLPPTSSPSSPSSSYKGKQRQQHHPNADASPTTSSPRPTSPNQLKRTQQQQQQQQASPTTSRKASRTTNASPSPSPTRSRSRSPSPRSSPASPTSSRTSPTSRRSQSSKSPPAPRNTPNQASGGTQTQRHVDDRQDIDDDLNGAFDPTDLVDDLSGGSTSVDSDTEERDVVITDGDSHFTLRVPQPLLLTSTIARGAYHQCGTARRVKVYELAGETWEDRGTGYCAGVYDEGQDEALLVARLEEHSIKLEGAMPDPRRPPNRLDPLLPLGEGGADADSAAAVADTGPFPYFLIVSQDLNTDAIMLKSRVVKEDVYQKQQETLVVWTEPDGTDMALSFQEAEGCLEVWEFIIEVQKHFHLNSGGAQHEVLSDPPTPDPGSPSSADYGVSAMGMGGLMQMDAASFALPNPSLATVARIDGMLKAAATKNPNLRERVAEWLARSNYIRKLTAFFQDAEYLEDLDALHCLCSIMQTIVMMNDSMIIETILQDDVFLDVVGMFEYDPEFPTLKASYRDYIENTAQYKQVVPIDDPKVVVKIHQAYRLQYLKDVILARILDDAMFSVLNSWIFFHQVDIVNYCTSNEAFLPQLFAICASDAGGSSSASQERKHEAVYLLQHLCAIGKQIQLPSRITLCKTLAEKGLLSVVEYALFEKVDKVQNAAAEMLMVLVEYDPNSVRNHVLAQVSDKQTTLVKKIAELLHTSQDLGLKAQMAEVLRILFDNSAEAAPPNASLAAAAAAARTKGEPDKFLTWFYESDVEHVFAPIKRLQRVNTMDPTSRLDLSPRHHSALLGHLCDLLCYTVAQHTFRSQYYVITSEIGAHVGCLLYAKEKHMRLAAIKFFRTCLAASNQFMNRHFAKQGIFESLLRLVQRESARDNLVLSACLELFEAISSQNLRTLISHLATEPCRSLMAALSQGRYTSKCFKTLLSQADSGAAEKVELPLSDESSTHVAEEQRRRTRDLMARGVHRTSDDEDEDQYFHEEDEDEQGDENIHAARGDGRQPVRPLRRTGASTTLVPYPDDEHQSDDSSSLASSSDDELPAVGRESHDDGNDDNDGAGAPGEGGFFRAGTKRPGEALKSAGASKKISLGLSSSSRKMAAGGKEGNEGQAQQGDKDKGAQGPT